MLDLGLIAGFEWDAGNARKSLDKHGVTQAEAEQIFTDDRLLLAHDIVHSETENRLQALGRTANGRRLHVTFTLRRDGTVTRVISARNMNRKERAHYESKA